MASNWRGDLAFSTRMMAVTQISSALLTSNPLMQIGDARMEATIAETKIYDEAQSLEDYAKLCEAKVASLSKPILDFPNEEDEEYVPTPGGRTIGKYQNATYYREGLFSAVYKAPALDDGGYFPPEAKNKVVALKVTTPSTMEAPHDSKREAKILSVAASDNVIPLLETFRENSSHFILVMPFMRYSVNELLQDKKLSGPQMKNCLKDLFSGLAHIHGQGIIHRDIKPSNILLKSLDGPAYLSDFGIAWAPGVVGAEPADSKITDVGTTCYRPPELLFGNTSYGCNLDLWAAGCTVAEVLDPNHATLFDSGELGSDLALIQSMFKKLGTPNLDVWPVCGRSLFNLETVADLSRRQLDSETGARCSSTSIRRRNGLRCYRAYQRLNVIWLAASSSTRAGLGWPRKRFLSMCTSLRDVEMTG